MSTIGLAITLINLVAGLLYLLILVRILISWVPISPWHPAVRLLRRIVDPILAPFRRILPALAGIDLSPLLAILVIFFVAQVATQVLSDVALGGGSVPIGRDIISAIGTLLLNIIIVLGILVLVRLLVSLFSASPWHPLVIGVRRMTDPLVAPFAHFGPRRSAYGYRTEFDIPALLTLIAYVVLYVVIRFLFDSVLASVF